MDLLTCAVTSTVHKLIALRSLKLSFHWNFLRFVHYCLLPVWVPVL